MKLKSWMATNLLLLLLIAHPAWVAAQTRQMVSELGIRLLVPPDWEWHWRDNKEIFINCAPQIAKGFGCSLIVTVLKVSADQNRITETDRRQWRSWQSAGGIRRIVSARDIVLAGYPAHEIISEEPLRSMRLFVLIPNTGRLYDIAYFVGSPANRNADFFRYKPAVDATLQTLAATSD
ncbi:MAG: hypothetical protein ACKVQK_30140 [Burkholderiales bacterium]